MRFGPWEIILTLVSLVIYFIPTIVAIIRRARNAVGVVVLNVLGGWTFVGWIIALVWSIIDKQQGNSSNSNA
jgi:uncharacterized membrane protein YhaH (DUF805 family)